METAEKIKAIETSGLQLAYDGCHKIYFLQDERRTQDALACGYQLHPASELRDLIRQSCSLVLVSRWGLNNDDFEHEWNIRQFTEDLREVVPD